MAIGDFYTQIIVISLAAAALLYAMAKKCIDAIQDLEDSFSQEGYILQSHIWTTDIKAALEDLNVFIQKNIMESESDDKYIELFSSKEIISSLKSKLNRLAKSYNDYINISKLMPTLIDEYDKSKKWLFRTIVICFVAAGWAAAGLGLGTIEGFLEAYSHIFWGIFFCLMFLTMSLFSKIIYHNRKCGNIRGTIRKIKIEYVDIIRGVA